MSEEYDDRSRRTRRGFVRGMGGILGASLVGVAGCRGFTGGGSSGESKGSTDTLSLTWWDEGDRIRRTVEVAELFSEQSSDVAVQTEPSDYAGYYDKLATRVAGGNPPDIFQLHITTLADYAERDSVRAIDDLWDKELGLSDVDESIRSACELNGTLYFVPLGVSTQPALIYNQTLLRELGVDRPEQGWTMGDFHTLADAVVEASGGEVYGTTDMGGSDTTLLAFVRSRGKSLFTSDGSVGIDEELLTDWFSLWDELRRSGTCVPMEVSAEGSGFENNPLVKGAAAVTSAASAKGIDGYANLMDDDLGLAAFPKDASDGPQGTVLGPVEWWALRSDLREEQAKTAARFCYFTLTNSEALSTMQLSHGASVFSDLRAEGHEQASGLTKLLYDNVAAVEEQDPEPLIIYPAGGQELVESELGELNEQIGFDGADIATAVDEFFAAAERIIDS